MVYNFIVTQCAYFHINQGGVPVRLSKQLLLIAIPFLLFSGCGSQPAIQTPVQQKAASPQVALVGSPFSLLRQESDKYLKSNRVMAIDAQEVYEKAVVNADPSYYLVDVRSDEHYAKHHIPGSIHISYADTWRANKTEFLPRDKKIVVIDYSGHSSSQVAALWSMMGFDAVAMKHGMAGWSKDKEVIGGSPIPCEPKNFAVVKDATPAGTHEVPALDLKASTLQELLQLSAEKATGKTVVIQADDVLAKVTAKSAFVLDVRASEHYGAGHIAGAVNIPFRSLTEEENLKKLPSTQQIVVVCYDGHAASQATRVLNQLGYDAVAMRDGMSLWTGDISVIGAKAIACTIPERLTAHLNAPLNPGPSTAAT